MSSESIDSATIKFTIGFLLPSDDRADIFQLLDIVQQIGRLTLISQDITRDRNSRLFMLWKLKNIKVEERNIVNRFKVWNFVGRTNSKTEQFKSLKNQSLQIIQMIIFPLKLSEIYSRLTGILKTCWKTGMLIHRGNSHFMQYLNEYHCKIM